MKTHLALLRGINVGGNKKVSMADLRAFVESIGFRDARTLLQSGNLVFRSDGQREDAALEIFLETEARKRLGLTTIFLVRTTAEWVQVVARNPFPEAARDHPNRLLVMFFREPPTSEALAALRTVMIPSERIHLDGKTLYASFPDGIGDSKAANAMMGTKFSRSASGRNWNTLLKLGALAGL